MALNAGIILSGQPVDAIGALQRGNQAAAQTNALRTQNDLTNLYRTQGANILAGEQGALNALAGIDPMAAMGMKTQTRQFEIMNAQERRAIAEAAAKMDDRQKAAALEQTKREVFRFLAAPDAATFDMMVTQAGKPELAGMFDRRQILAADYVSSVEEALRLGTPERPDWRNATPEEAAKFGALAGQINDKTGKFEPINPPPRTSWEILPGGGVRYTQGSGVGDSGGFKPADPTLMIGSIDAILNDPALPYATGWLEWTQNIPGTGAKRFGTRADQLNGQAFLQAFESLKGAGQITEIEGAKATQAVGRLDTAQSAEDYAQALRELRELLILGASREPGTAAAGATTPAAPQSPAMPPPPSPEAVEILRGNNTPEYRQFFDEVFGPGAAARALGGN